MLAETIGLFAAALTTISFLPQAVRVIRTGDTSAISLWMYVLFVTGVACWETYGLLIGSRPVIIANFVTMILASAILTQKIRHVLAAKRAD
ncbi:MAG: SemiSWEET transporter [Pseudomonadota bacterium]|nr:SemiSWEET transporter [Pseudomonadota bacterium]